ncbi:hypothetical protein N7541_006903 [Penicillium brevicompactum]|uniref:Uncharacterized protein n=1 Tax=Penicillium brevicompactum TaxID=5074 RepID=A0A9W9URZ0_PENBR|nr:hypothetical protein N7541_006903 [Penicillium brevicompactum]
MGLFFLRESYGPKILHDRAIRLRKKPGDDSYQTEAERQQSVSREHCQRFCVALSFTLSALSASFSPKILVNLYIRNHVIGSLDFPLKSSNYHSESIGIGGLN